MVVVVTGAAGHLGANLVRALLDRGEVVRAFDFTDNWRSLGDLDVERVRGDIREPEALREIVRGADAVYHTAARISLSRKDGALTQAINVGGTRNVVDACLSGGVGRLIHFSSIHALVQEPVEVPVDESRPLVSSPRNPPYDRSKAAGEREVLAGVTRGLNAVILNPTGMIGPHDYGPSHFGRVLLTLGAGHMPIFVETGFDWVDVRDVVAGALAARDRGRAGARYLLSGHWISMRDLAGLVSEVTGARAPSLYCSLDVARLALPFAAAAAPFQRGTPIFTPVALEALRGNPRVSHALATRDLGYAPRPLRATLEDTFRWFQDRGMLEARERVASPLPGNP